MHLEICWDNPATSGGVSVEKIEKGDSNISIVDTSGQTGGHIKFTTDGTEKMRLTSDGRLGIGVTNPGEKLEVNGAIRIGDASSTNDGVIRYNGTDFLGRKGGI